MGTPEETVTVGLENVSDEQVARLESLYLEIVNQRSTNRKLTMVGILGILILLLIFCLRLYSIFGDYNKYVSQIKPDNLMKVLEEPNTDIKISEYDHPAIEGAFKNMIKEGHERLVPAVKRSQEKLVKEILPDFSERVTENMSDRHEEFVKAGQTLQTNLTTHIEKQLKADIMEVLGEELAKSSDEINKEFPELNDKKLAEELKNSEAYLYDELHALGMRKVAKFDPVLRALNQRIDSLAAGQKVTPEMREQITDAFFEALFDRMKYEFVPSLGEQIPPPPTETTTPEVVKTTKEGGAE